MRAKYVMPTTVPCPISTTPKTIIAVRAGGDHGLDLYEWSISFDGISSGLAPVLVELCSWSGSGLGTASGTEAVNPRLIGGRDIGFNSASGKQNYITEPTVLTVIKSMLLVPNGGTFVATWDSMVGIDSGIGEGFAIRATASSAASVNARAYLEFYRI